MCFNFFLKKGAFDTYDYNCNKAMKKICINGKKTKVVSTFYFSSKMPLQFTVSDQT